nr:hypothetical protein [Lewinella sp. W8]
MSKAVANNLRKVDAAAISRKRMAYAWSRSRMGGWAIAQSPIMGTTVTEARLAQRGYRSFTKYYEQLFHG